MKSNTRTYLWHCLERTIALASHDTCMPLIYVHLIQFKAFQFNM